MRWLLMLHQIPPKPAYFRAKVLRRLQQIGALGLKNSAYLLPENDETLEDTQWLCQEIRQEGGEVWLFRVELISGLTNESLVEAFCAIRNQDYSELLEVGKKLLQNLTEQTEMSQLLDSTIEPDYDQQWRKLNRHYQEVKRIDFFNASGQKDLEEIMNSIDNILHKKTKAIANKPLLADLKSRTWVTRRGIKIDRIACVWLIERFIDHQAKFRFVDLDTYSHQATEIRFDMFEGEFTHEGDQCTFEVLLNHIASNDLALKAVGEVIHDIDLKDGKYQRPEAIGILQVIEGILLRHKDDLRRLEEGKNIFESLYTRFSSQQHNK